MDFYENILYVQFRETFMSQMKELQLTDNIKQGISEATQFL